MHAGLQVRLGIHCDLQDLLYVTIRAIKSQMPSVSAWDRSELSHANQERAGSRLAQPKHSGQSHAFNMCTTLVNVWGRLPACHL